MNLDYLLKDRPQHGNLPISNNRKIRPFLMQVVFGALRLGTCEVELNSYYQI
jgi:hypothetical protein